MAKTDCKSEPRVTEVPQPTTRCEFYSRAAHRAIFLRGEWIEQAGFAEGMPLKLRVMPECIVITAQNGRELWGCVEGLSVAHINHKKVKQWIKDFPGALQDSDDAPVFRRSNGGFV